MKVCIAEKPSVAKELAQIIGAKTKKDGYFEGNGYQVTWTFGHLCTLKEPHDYEDYWRTWRIETLPIIPPRFGIKLISNKGVEKQFNTIQQLVKNCSEIINCGDAGIEGELIQRWVLQKAACKAPMKRLWISSLTEESIRKGFENLKDGNDFNLLYMAGNARAIGDWLLGMNATRLYTLKYANGKAVLSIGRVQTPTLALIVHRHLEIVHFKSTPFWEIKTTYREVIFSSTKGRYEIKEDAEQILQKIKESLFTITSFTRKKGFEAPPSLFDLTALQVECNKKYNFSADETLQLIQTLYEKKLVTYPRVDTTYLPNDMYSKIPKILEEMKPYQRYTEPLLKDKIKKSKKVFDDKKITDHHAIIPTGVNPDGLNLAQKQVYDTIARRFIAAFYPDCMVQNTTVLGEAGGFEFKATGKIIIEQGWRILYPAKTENDTPDEDQIMPEFVENETGSHQPDLQEKQTTPPKYYTEATLLRAMETAGKQIEDEDLREAMKDNGIGRPSTRANIIETLFKRNYMVRQRKNLVPTQTGIELIGIIQNDLLKSVELTGTWEKKLRQIEKGEFDVKLFFEEMKQLVTDLVTSVKQEQRYSITIQDTQEQVKTPKKETTATANTPLKCPKCKSGEILKGKQAYGCSAFAQGCQFKIPFVFADKKLTEKQITEIITKGKTSPITGFIKDGNKIKGRLVLNIHFEPELELIEEKPTPNHPETIPCPACKKGFIIKGKTAYGCSEYKTGCKFLVSFDRLQQNFQTTVLTTKILHQILE